MINTDAQKERDCKGYFRLFGCGFAMGMADVVPGVSGGTMAFILGIYEELINSIRKLASREVVALLLGFRLKELFAELPWKFLAALGAGLFAAVFSLAHILEALLTDHPVSVWSFFFGLVAASIWVVSQRVKVWKFHCVAGAVVGTIAAYIIVGLIPVATPDDWWFLFLSGVIAICAMILPGISGSFILVLLGKYQYILAAVTNRDFVTLSLVASGCAVGIISFAQVIGWFFKKHHDITVAVLIGLMAGSLRKIWPWKETLREMLDRHGDSVPVEQINILPTGNITAPVLLAVLGLAIVILLDHIAVVKEA